MICKRFQKKNVNSFSIVGNKFSKIFFCLDKISFRRDYKSCQVGVVVVRRLSLFVVPQLWELCDGITSVILELHFWDLVHCLLISFCFGSEILKKIGPPQPPKKTKKPQKKTYGFSRWDILPTLWVRRLGFGTVFTNIILLWIRNFEENPTTPTPKKTQKTPKKTYGFSQWDNLPTLWFRRLGFGIVHSNIFLLWIWKYGEIRTTLTPLNPPHHYVRLLCDKASWPIKVCTNDLICIMSFWFSLIVFQLISFLLNLIFINMFQKIEFGLICSVVFYLTFLINVYIRL